jgi:hypothetical protein
MGLIASIIWCDVRLDTDNCLAEHHNYSINPFHYKADLNIEIFQPLTTIKSGT